MGGWGFSHNHFPTHVLSGGTDGTVEARGSKSMEERMSGIPLDKTHCPSIRVRENSLRAIPIDDLLPMLCDPVNCFFPRERTEFARAFGSYSKQGTSETEG
jgi:hypothetical protein